ncbi:MAG: ATP-binding protein, partial [Bacteroidota bacterium]
CLSWSSGKDAAMALHHLQGDPAVDVQRLLTTITGHRNRVTMHGLRRELLERQVAQLDVPLTVVNMPEQPTMEAYEAATGNAMNKLGEEGFTHVAYGDIFLEDLRAYREKQVTALGFSALFPLWKRDTQELIREFIDLGFRAVIIGLQADKLDRSLLGREVDATLLRDLPNGVDPCGEKGEFHTFCFDGPIFRNAVPFQPGEAVFREYPAPGKASGTALGCWFLDLL